MSATLAQQRSHHVATAGRLVGSTASPSVESSGNQVCLSRQDFEVFVGEYSGRLLAVARRFLRCEEDAADAVQDAFLSALAARNSFLGDSTVYTWLYRIVVNVCLMKIRSQPRVKTISLDEIRPAFDDNGTYQHLVAVWSQGVERRLERAELHAAIRACIDQLPMVYRTILLLRDIEQLDTDETAELLTLSRCAVKTRLHRARQALRVLLESVVR